MDRAIATAQRYAGVRSTIVVCGDVAVGGLALNGFPFRHDSGIALRHEGHDALLGLDDGDRETVPGELDGCREAVGAGTDYHGIVNASCGQLLNLLSRLF